MWNRAQLHCRLQPFKFKTPWPVASPQRMLTQCLTGKWHFLLIFPNTLLLYKHIELKKYSLIKKNIKDRKRYCNNNKKITFFLLQFWNSQFFITIILFAMLPMGITGICFNVFMPLFTIVDVFLTNNGMKIHIVN